MNISFNESTKTKGYMYISQMHADNVAS